MSNPVFNENTIRSAERILDGAPCTVKGTVNKTFMLLSVVVAAFCVTFYMCLQNRAEMAMGLGTVSFIVAFILAMIISFKQKTAPALSPVYAACEGLGLGAISFYFETLYHGIVVQAVAATMGTLFLILVLYSTKIIQVTDRLRSTIITATFGVALIYLVGLLLSLFHINFPIFYSSNIASIAFSLIVCFIAASNFFLDFDIIERLSGNFAPKFYEWYGAFSLLVTLVWVYIEILRLLSKLRSRN